MSQSVSLSSATAPSSSGARAHTRAFTRQLAELETPLSLRTNQPEIGPSFLQLLHPSTPPPSGRKYGRPQYQSSDNSSDADEYDEDFAFSAVNPPPSSDTDSHTPSITISSAHHPLSPSIVISNPSSTGYSTTLYEPRPPSPPPHPSPLRPPFQSPLATTASLRPQFAGDIVQVSTSTSVPIMSVSSEESSPGTPTMKLPHSLMPEPFHVKSTDDVELWLKRFDQYARLQGWPDVQKGALLPLLFRGQAQVWFDGLSSDEKANYQALCAALLRRYQPHKSMKWVLLRQFQDRRQQPNESVEDYFQSMHQKGKYLKKAPLDIMETIVSGLLPPVSKFVMLRSPQTLEQALDLALTASVLQQDSTTDKVEVALATITDKIGALQTNLNSIQSQTPLQRTPPARQFTFQRQTPNWTRNVSSRYQPTDPRPPLGNRPPGRPNPRPPQQDSRFRQYTPFRRQQTPCLSCGGNHARDQCRMRNAHCNFCSKIGHIAPVCKQRNRPQ